MKLIHKLFYLAIFLLSSNYVFAEDISKKNDLNTVIEGRFNPKTHSDFVKINKKYSSRSNIYLNKEAYEAFIKMSEKAKEENIDLKIISAMRTFNGQKSIWERKWKKNKSLEPVARAKKILRYSSMPSTSRHHWGTDMDINSLESSYFSSGKGQKEYAWLEKNAKDFGFCQPYTAKGEERKTGYNEEKWHWSYINVAKRYTDYVSEYLSNHKTHGFLGADTAPEIDILNNYILGINKNCL
jgi:LAS superfamily LD-carboxypeptidase LdcB